MKKILSIAIVCMMLMPCICSMPVSFAAKQATIIAKTYADILVGTATEVTFTCESVSSKSILSLVDETGKSIASLRDNGTKGDTSKNDGVFSANVTMFSDERKLIDYSIYDGETLVKKVHVNFYTELTSEDYAVKNSVLDGISIIENDMKHNSDIEITDAVEAYLNNNINVCNVVRETPTQVAYETMAGIQCVFAKLSETSKGSSELYTLDNGELTSFDTKDIDIDSYTNPNVLIVRPFRHYEGENGFHNDNYLNAANKITAYTGGVVTALDDTESCPFNIKENLFMNGFFMVDSHGIKHGTRSYIYVSDGAGYTSADLQAGRAVILGYEHVCISGEFFQVEYEQRGITLDNTLCYLGTCSGMEQDTLYRPLLELGASAVFGYDASVTFAYEAQIMTTLFARYTAEDADNEGHTYTISDSISHAKSIAGSIDPNNGVAVMIMEGNGNHRVLNDAVTLESFSFAGENGTAYVNNPFYIDTEISPYNAHGFEQEWTSSDESVATIFAPSIARGVGNGTATITCTVTDSDGVTVFTDSFELTVETSYVTDISIEISGTNARFDVGQSRKMRVSILPWNASNKTVIYSTNCPGIVDVNAEGIVKATAPGTVAICCTSGDGGLTEYLMTTVSTASVFVRESELVDGETYAIVGTASAKALTGNINDKNYFNVRELIINGDILGGNVNNSCMWTVTMNADNTFYLKNKSSAKYMSYAPGGLAALTDTPETSYYFSGTKLTITNPESDDYSTMRLRSAGFSYDDASSGVKLSVFKQRDFSDTTRYATVTYMDRGEVVATVCVEKGARAALAMPIVENEGHTFLGWDAPLCNITENLTVNALYSEEAYENNVVTFIDSVSGETLATVEADENSTVTAPDAPTHEDMDFIGWSEDFTSVSCNMTVFAMYKSQRLLGDSNGDGRINTGDATHVLRYTVGIVELSAEDMSASDMTQDGNINTGDAVAILRLSVGL